MYERFEELRRLFGVTVAAICAETGINRSTMSEWKNGKFKLKDDKRKLLANYFGVSLAVLDGEEPIPEALIVASRESGKYDSVTWQGKRLKPVFECAAGQGAINGDYSDKYIVEEKPDDEHTWCQIHGDSMYPVLFDGDFVKVLMQTETSPKDLTVVKVDGETVTVKYVEITDRGIWLRAVNKEVFEDKFYTVQDVLTLPITILGKVVEMKRNFV